MYQFKLIEKKNHLAVHGLFQTRQSAERHLTGNVPEYCKRGFFMDKTLKPESFTIISA